MSITLIEIDPAANIRQTAKRNPRLIYEHLRYYCSKFSPLPAIMIRLSGSEAELLDRAEYLHISRDLKRPSVQAVVTDRYSEEDLARFLSMWNGRLVDWEHVDDAERAKPSMLAWHVFFLERPLRPKEREEFENRVAGFFKRLAEERGDKTAIVSEVSYNVEQASAEFQATTPVGDESWYLDHLRVCRAFSENVVRILSYQGRRF